VWRASAADMGGVVVSLLCRQAGTSRAQRRPVTRVSGVAAERKREKVGAAAAAEGKGKKRSGAKQSGERCGVSGERRNKGKLTSGPRAEDEGTR
jgi:hypothetical protein